MAPTHFWRRVSVWSLLKPGKQQQLGLRHLVKQLDAFLTYSAQRPHHCRRVSVYNCYSWTVLDSLLICSVNKTGRSFSFHLVYITIVSMTFKLAYYIFMWRPSERFCLFWRTNRPPSVHYAFSFLCFLRLCWLEGRGGNERNGGLNL